jgi:DNA-binding NarL/FixJ family response regulator
MPKLALAVCVYSFHPWVLAELNRLITKTGAALISHKLEASHVADLKSSIVPNASAYVLEANARSRTTQSIVEQILVRHPKARVLVVAERLDEAAAFPLLRLGVKGLLSYAELAQHLAPAVAAVAAGGCWVPRAVLSRFVDSTLAAMPRMVSTSPHLSRREREVRELLMKNLSNKEIAKRLNVSERTVKFHVSNLLGKYGVKRRVDLILLSFSERQSA